METFAAKVRYGAGIRFDPTMEDRGGWIAGEAQPQDVEMSDVVIEILAEANHASDRGGRSQPIQGLP